MAASLLFGRLHASSGFAVAFAAGLATVGAAMISLEPQVGAHGRRDLAVSDRSYELFLDALPRNAGGDFRYTPESPHGVVARGDVRPSQVEDVELAFAAGALSLDVHPLQEIGIALGVNDDHHLVLARGVDAFVTVVRFETTQLRFSLVAKHLFKLSSLAQVNRVLRRRKRERPQPVGTDRP